MNNLEQLDKRFRSIAWGAAFILVGALSLIPGDQTIEAIVGVGVILIALNVARSMSGIPMSGFTLALGVAGLITGALVLFRSQLGLHFEIDVIPVVLIALGIYCLWPRRKLNESSLP